jgi:hypothetical protein
MKALKMVFRGNIIVVNELRWKGTQVDLIEFAYGLYLTGMLVDAYGHKATLAETTDYVFKMFGMTPPQNPSRVVSTLKQRIKPEELSVMYKTLCDLYQGCFIVKK